MAHLHHLKSQPEELRPENILFSIVDLGQLTQNAVNGHLLMLYLNMFGLIEIFAFSCTSSIVYQREELLVKLVKIAREIDLYLLLGFLRHPLFVFGCQLINGFVVFH